MVTLKVVRHRWKWLKKESEGHPVPSTHEECQALDKHQVSGVCEYLPKPSHWSAELGGDASPAWWATACEGGRSFWFPAPECPRILEK